MNTLKALRQRKGLDQLTVATPLGVARNTVSSWETGRTEPNSEQMVKLCEILSCTPGELLGMEGIEAARN